MERKTYRLRLGWNWFYLIFFPMIFVVFELLPFIFPEIQNARFGTLGHIIQGIGFVVMPLFLFISKRSKELYIDTEKIIFKTLFKKQVIFIRDIKRVNYGYSHGSYNYGTYSRKRFDFINYNQIVMLRVGFGMFKNNQEESEFLNTIYKSNNNIKFDKDCLDILSQLNKPYKGVREDFKELLREFGLNEKQVNLVSKMQIFAAIGVGLFVVLMIVFVIIVPMLSQL